MAATGWKVALSDVEMAEAEVRAVSAVIASRWLSAGPLTREFEIKFARMHGTSDAVAVSSGTAALHLATVALGLGPGDEVIVPSLTFVASAAAIAHTGARPVFADVTGAADLNLAPEDVARRIGPRTKALVVVHYGGYPADMAALCELARTHGLAIIEDAAHAPLVPTPLGMVGTIGDVGCFSFFANKNVVTGEGGMVVTKDPAMLARVRSLRSHCMTVTSWDRQQGRSGAYDVDGLGFNYRPTEVTAALGLVQLERLAEDRRRRRRQAALYRQLLDGSPYTQIPFTPRDDSAHHIFPVLFASPEQRAAVQQELTSQRIQSSIHYPPIHLFSWYRENYGGRPGDLPLTEELSARLLSLPIHARLTDGDVECVATAVRRTVFANRQPPSAS